MAESPTSSITAARTRHLWKFRILAAAVSTILSIGLAEILCRALISPQVSIRFEQDVDELQGMNLKEAAGMMENDADLFWKLAPNTKLPEHHWPFFGVVSNGDSLRENHKIPIRKPAGQIRILFLGDSCTYGYGVAHNATFTEACESVLENRLKSPVECINAGVPGYSLFQGSRYLATKGLAYEPDLVVLNFGWNDAGIWDHLGDRQHHEILQAMVPPPPLAKSRLAEMVWGRMHKPDPPSDATKNRPRLLPDEFAQNLKEIHHSLSAKDIPVLILVWPMQFNIHSAATAETRTEYQVAMREFGEGLWIQKDPPVPSLLDLIPLGRELVGRHGVNGIYYDQGHVTPTAHQAIGTAIADHLMPWLAPEKDQGAE
jgi:lysophospholipase L1-like esterase